MFHVYIQYGFDSLVIQSVKISWMETLGQHEDLILLGINVIHRHQKPYKFHAVIFAQLKFYKVSLIGVEIKFHWCRVDPLVQKRSN